jgi:hypothetical protein
MGAQKMGSGTSQPVNQASVQMDNSRGSNGMALEREENNMNNTTRGENVGSIGLSLASESLNVTGLLLSMKDVNDVCEITGVYILYNYSSPHTCTTDINQPIQAYSN